MSKSRHTTPNLDLILFAPTSLNLIHWKFVFIVWKNMNKIKGKWHAQFDKKMKTKWKKQRRRRASTATQSKYSNSFVNVVPWGKQALLSLTAIMATLVLHVYVYCSATFLMKRVSQPVHEASFVKLFWKQTKSKNPSRRTRTTDLKISSFFLLQSSALPSELCSVSCFFFYFLF